MNIDFPSRLRILLEYISIQFELPINSILIESFNLYLEKYRNLLIQYPSYKKIIHSLDCDPDKIFHNINNQKRKRRCNTIGDSFCKVI